MEKVMLPFVQFVEIGIRNKFVSIGVDQIFRVVGRGITRGNDLLHFCADEIQYNEF